ncbi:MAG: M4 family metallopeptidase [Nocardioides sp.]|uniref:M4 family metallopeptidase n=1 Tax=Nocardioides sp. TaxID=35761 RepID=UPI0039E2C758
MKQRVISGLTLALVVSASWLAPATAQAATQAATPSAQPSQPARPDRSDAAAKGAGDFVATRPSRLHLAKQDKAAQTQVYRSHGLSYVAYDRTYRGLDVVGGDFVVATDDAGKVVATSVAQTKPTRVGSITPSISTTTARQKAAGLVDDASLGETRLVVFQDEATSHLAYETYATGTRDGEPSRLAVYVDAHSGKVVGTKEHVLHGTGSGTYNGPKPVTFGTTLSGSTYAMKDPAATNLSCQDAATNTTFTQSADTGWGGGAATDRETACVDALYAADKEIAMLSAWDGRNGPDGNGGAWPIRIGDQEENAYYDGTQVQVGYDDDGAWISSIDVLAHEMGHGVDDNTPGGISAKGTQEFVADTFGAATEWYANQSAPYDTPDFTVGEEVNLGGAPIRYMYNPSLAGDSNCYSSSTPTAEVHAAAGPGNHWFYLLAEGTSPTDGQPASPTCNSSSITGIGIQKAEQIMYNAMLLKTSSSSYLKYRTWTLTAAKSLFPSSCTEFNAVKAAWDAVSVPAQSADPTCTAGGGTTTVTVANPGSKTGTVGTAISSFTLSASGGTAPYTWSATGLPAGVSISSAGTVSGTPTTAGTYSVTASATDSAGAAGTTSFTFTVSGGSSGTCSGNKIANPGFESGATSWTQSSGVIDSSTSAAARTGSYKAWLDGYGSTHTDTLSQSVTVPAGCTATFTFWVNITTKETTTSTAYDKLTVKAGSTTLATYSNLNKSSGYVQKSFSLTSLAGTTFTISFSGVEDSSLATSFLVDDTALTLG